MKVLFIGGTGNISTEVSRLCVESGIDLYLLNRGKRSNKIEGTKSIVADISDFDSCKDLLSEHEWDAVVNWIAFTSSDIKRDIKLFSGKTNQYVFISSASIYQKPPNTPFITESTPIKNPYWQYSRNKIECEEILIEAWRNSEFPVTIVRPSHTYDVIIPVVIGGGSDYTTVDRIKKGKKIIVHGDGTSLWVVTHSKDFAKGFVGLLGHQQAIGEAFHITSDEVLTWNQIHEAIAEVFGQKANIVHIPSDFLAKYDKDFIGSLLGDKSHSVIFDNSKIKRFVPDFSAPIPFRKGIKETIKWFEDDLSRQKINEDLNNLIDKIISDFESISK